MKRKLEAVQRDIEACASDPALAEPGREELRAKIETWAKTTRQLVDSWTAGMDDEPDMVTIAYECGNAWTTLHEKETMPALALDFLELVTPVIEVTLAKHTYANVHFVTLLYDTVKRPADVEPYAPAEWETKGNGRWNDSIFGYDSRKRAWNYYREHVGEHGCDEKTLALYDKKSRVDE